MNKQGANRLIKLIITLVFGSIAGIALFVHFYIERHGSVHNGMVHEHALLIALFASFCFLMVGGIAILGIRHYHQKSENNAHLIQQYSNRFQTLFEHAPLAYQSLDADGTILDVNDAWLKLADAETPDQVTGHNITEFLTEHSIDTLHDTFPKFLKESRVDGPLFEFRSLQRKVHLVEVNGQVGRDEAGNFLRTHCILTDVTERKKAEQALVESEARFRRLIDKAPFPLCQISYDGKLELINQRMTDILGYTIEDTKTLEELWRHTYPDPEYRQRIADEWFGSLRRAKESHSQIPELDSRVICKDGAKKQLVVFGIPLNEGYIVSFYDTTELIKTRQSNLRRGEILQTLSQISLSLLQNADWEASIPEALKGLTHATETDRIYLFENRTLPDGQEVSEKRYAWSHNPSERDIEGRFQRIAVNDPRFRRWTVRMLRGKTVVSNLSELSLQTHIELSSLGIKSIVLIPIYIESHWRGMLYFESSQQEREWPLPELMAMESAAATIGAIWHRHEIAQEMTQLTEFLESATSAGNIGLYNWNFITNQHFYSNQWKAQLGYRPDEFPNNEEAWEQSIHPDDKKKLIELKKKILHGHSGDRFKTTYRLRHKNGQYRWIMSIATLTKSDDGEKFYLQGAHIDITESKEQEDQLQLAETVFNNSREGLIITDAAARIIRTNPAFQRLTGFRIEDVYGKTPSILKSDRQDAHFYETMWREINSNGHWQGEIWNRRKDGEIYPELLSINAVTNVAGEVTNYVGAFTDISRQKAFEQQLEYMAYHDHLTHLPNRRMIISQLEHTLSLVKREPYLPTLLLMDLDRFKDINDSYGHAIGDEVLIETARRLKQSLRESDTVARLGGDEFAILIETLTLPHEAGEIASKLIEDLKSPFEMSNGVSTNINISIGISICTSDRIGAEEMLQQADAALYKSKAEGRARFSYFSEELTRQARYRLEEETRLNKALRNHELAIYLQPQYDLASDRIIGAEALVRWIDPVRGIILPGRFIPLAEETGQILPIGTWVLQETARQGKRWLEQGFPPLKLSVNLSARQLHSSEITDVIEHTLNDSGYPAENLVIELTESVLMKDTEKSLERLNRLRQLGIHIALDDFGTGYSSLAYLQQLPLDTLKVDKRFIDDIPEKQADITITTTIIALGHALGLSVLAEGVETEAQLSFLTEQGCDQYQGFLRHQPLPVAAFEKLLSS